MKVKVKLYGALSQLFPDYQPSQGMEVELPDRATAKGLLAHLGISGSQRAVVIVNGRILGADDEIVGGASVNIVQAIGGG
jgi:sulfur carrier protein ThiS